MTEKSKFIPKHKKIFDEIARRIYSRNYKYQERLPSLDAFCKEFSVSQVTIKTVMRNLQKNKLIRSVRRGGTFVCWKKEDEYYKEAVSNPPCLKRIKLVYSLLAPTPLYEYIMTRMAETFMQHNPHIEIKLIKIFSEGAEDPYLERIANGDLPACGEFFWHGIYARKNALYPLDTFPDFSEFRQELHPKSFYYTRDEDAVSHVHALYLYFDVPSFMGFNLDILEKHGISLNKPSITWNGLLRHVRKLSDAVSGDRYSAGINQPYSYHKVKPFLEVFAQDLLSKECQPDSKTSFVRIFDTESALIGLENLRMMADNKNILRQSCDEFFALGKLGIHPFSNNYTLNLLSMLNSQFNCHLTSLPPVGNLRHYRPFLSGFSVGIFRNSITSDAQLYAVWEWLKFFFHKRSQYHLTSNFKLPVRIGVTPYMEEKTPLLGSMANILLSKSVPQPDFAGQRRLFSIIGQKLSHFFQDKTSPELCLKEIKDSIAPLLKEPE